MIIENITLSKRRRRQKATRCIHLLETARTGKSVEKIDQGLPGAVGEGQWEATANGHRVPFRGDESVLELDSGEGGKTCEHNQDH